MRVKYGVILGSLSAAKVTLLAAPLSLFNTLDTVFQDAGSWLGWNVRLNCF